ncbi:uncharacterized protein LOC133883770 [Phragmites australis]|uniref:uncharacterized protein LOC133883770 n=1 Tax=Phragmites australis TaxID=29695 RepID=UPI002D792E78|nr:uncharacterized protein LOC133883770 [Phragmites australis]
MAPYCFDDDADWYHALEDFPPLCSSTSPLAMSVEDHLPIAVAPPSPRSSKNDLQGSDHGALLTADCSSSASILRDEDNYHLSMFSAPAPPASGDPYYDFNQLPPIAVDGATVGLDDALQLPFSDIDMEAFGDTEHKATLADNMMIVSADRYTVCQNAGVDVHGHQQPRAIADCYRPGANGFEMTVRHHGEHHQASSVAALPPPPPLGPSLPRARGTGSGDRSAPAGKTSLDHIGLDELRKYFYMPITKAAREMNVGLTVLKKRCRELGVARWPHRKMKSLKSLIVSVQEMGNGMSPAVVQRELAELETYCALMEDNPSIELTDRTKKLRQACFKESYKRRRAASSASAGNEACFKNYMIDHIYNFGHYHQLPLQPEEEADLDNGDVTDKHGYDEEDDEEPKGEGNDNKVDEEEKPEEEDDDNKEDNNNREDKPKEDEDCDDGKYDEHYWEQPDSLCWSQLTTINDDKDEDIAASKRRMLH